MAVLPKPAGHIDWVADEDAGKVQEPTAGKKALGYVADERPPPKEHNWLWARIGNWQKYFESFTDEIALQTLEYNVIVGSTPGSTHATLAAAVADVALGPDQKVLVLEPQSLGATIQLTKAGWHIVWHPKAEYDPSGATTAIEIDADRITLENFRITGFTTAAIKVNTGRLRARIVNGDFVGNTVDVNDVDGDAVQLGNHSS